MPAWAQGHSIRSGHGGHGGHSRGGPRIPAGFGELSGDVIDLTVGSGHRIVEGRRGPGIAVNGSVPGPLIRLREGQNVRLNVTNNLETDTSVHWHGFLLPFHMDGVPGISFPGIKPGQTFTYEFPIRQSGTYWYHSHSGLQEQSGHYGPMIIDPAGAEPVEFDRDCILLLSDFTVLDPHFIMSRLRTGTADLIVAGGVQQMRAARERYAVLDANAVHVGLQLGVVHQRRGAQQATSRAPEARSSTRTAAPRTAGCSPSSRRSRISPGSASMRRR